jgi:hypothetical protein
VLRALLAHRSEDEAGEPAPAPRPNHQEVGLPSLLDEGTRGMSILNHERVNVPA